MRPSHDVPIQEKEEYEMGQWCLTVAGKDRAIFIDFFFFFVSKTHKKEKKIHGIKKMNKKEKNSEFTHPHGNTYKY